jgi:hypothetical protein
MRRDAPVRSDEARLVERRAVYEAVEEKVIILGGQRRRAAIEAREPFRDSRLVLRNKHGKPPSISRRDICMSAEAGNIDCGLRLQIVLSNV